MKRVAAGDLLAVVTLSALGMWTVASTMPHTFQAGEVIRSADVNDNFEALHAGKQNRVTGECAPGSSIRVINDDGSVDCQVDQVGEPGTSGVDSLNGMTGSVVLQAGANIDIDDSAPGQLTISASEGRGSGAQRYTAGERLALSGNQFLLDTAFTDARYVTLDASGGLAVKGASGPGDIPVQGDGVRLMWYPGKGAIRAGGVEGPHWNEINVGLFSSAFGANTRASGNVSTATGAETTAPHGARPLPHAPVGGLRPPKRPRTATGRSQLGRSQLGQRHLVVKRKPMKDILLKLAVPCTDAKVPSFRVFAASPVNALRRRCCAQRRGADESTEPVQ